MESATRISATDLARSLSDVLNRVKYRGECFVVERSGEPIAEIRPVKPWRDVTPEELVRLLARVPLPGDGFGEELARLRAAQGEARDPWRS